MISLSRQEQAIMVGWGLASRLALAPRQAEFSSTRTLMPVAQERALLFTFCSPIRGGCLRIHLVLRPIWPYFVRMNDVVAGARGSPWLLRPDFSCSSMRSTQKCRLLVSGRSQSASSYSRRVAWSPENATIHCSSEFPFLVRYGSLEL